MNVRVIVLIDCILYVLVLVIVYVFNECPDLYFSNKKLNSFCKLSYWKIVRDKMLFLPQSSIKSKKKLYLTYCNHSICLKVSFTNLHFDWLITLTFYMNVALFDFRIDISHIKIHLLPTITNPADIVYSIFSKLIMH